MTQLPNFKAEAGYNWATCQCIIIYHNLIYMYTRIYYQCHYPSDCYILLYSDLILLNKKSVISLWLTNRIG